MTFFSRKTDYALLILHSLAGSQAGMSARQIASMYGIGRPFVANILKMLCSTGMLNSHRGAFGGYSLARPLGVITLDQVFEACEEPFELTDCTSNDSESCFVFPACPLKHAMGELHTRLITLLRNVTLEDLFRSAPSSNSVITIGIPKNLVSKSSTTPPRAL